MPAPPASIIAALRDGTVRRHLFFYIDHAGGAVRCWDGVGQFVFGGNTFLGIGGAAEIAGVSNSADPQNHAIAVTLNGVPFSTMQDTTPDIRGKACSIHAVFIRENGTVLASRQLFAGVGDVLRSKITRAGLQLTCHVRGHLADWSSAPRAYYAGNDQRARFAGDSGFDLVRTLENSTIAGWSKNVEAGGGTPYFGATPGMLRDDVSQEPVGHHANGASATLFFVGGSVIYVKDAAGTQFYEQTTGALVASSALSGGARVQLGGVNSYVDAAGDARSAGGKLLLLGGGGAATTQRLRKQGAITSDGTATGTTVSRVFVAAVGGLDYYYVCKTGAYSATGADQSPRVYGSKNNSSVALTATAGGAAPTTLSGWQEDVTATAVTFSAGGNLQVGGSNCVVSTTGVILSSGGRRIVKTADTAVYLRVWT